jgi:uncharacterized protein (DUF924 family)
MVMDHATPVLDFWFGREDFTPAILRERMGTWFGTGDAASAQLRDQDIAQRFGALVGRALAGELQGWADSPRQRLALILLLDQFPRHLHRGSAQAFAGDARALELTLDGMQKGADAALDPVMRIFFCMPLQHSELPDAQEDSVLAFRRLAEDAPAELRPVFDGVTEFARRHRDIIARFGRFPHRNAVLDRASTPEELEWLSGGGERFGQ